MGYLSDALKKYYTRDGSRVVFTTDASLSSVALQMWEALGFQKVDASVLSRVLKGERLFTPSQLHAFSIVLALSQEEEAYLNSCLSKDYFKKDNIALDMLWGSDHELLTIFESLVLQAVELFYEGKSREVIKQSDIITTLYERTAITNLSLQQLQKFFDLYGYYIFLKGRSVAGTMKPNDAERAILSTVSRLESLSKTYQRNQLYAYAQILRADVWYMKATYAFSKKDAFKKALTYAHDAFLEFDQTHREKLAALRLMSASACYIHDEETIRYAEAMLKQLLPSQPHENSVNAIHLSKILSKGKVMLGDAHPFSAEEKVWNHFENSSKPDGIYYQLSDIKTRIETFSLFKLRDKSILVPLLERGLSLAGQGDYPRHKGFFESRMRQFS